MARSLRVHPCLDSGGFSPETKQHEPSTRGNKMRRHGISLLLSTILLAPSLPAQVVQLYAIEGGTPTAFVASGESLFASTRSGYIYVSNDGGASWNISHAGDGRPLACLAKLESVIYAGGWNGVVRSTDRGESWEKSDSGLPQEPRVTSLLSYDTLLYATTERGPTPDRGGIYVSLDMGRHWTLLFTVEGGNSARQVSTIARKGNVLCAGSDSLFRSTDGGITWKSVLKTPLFCTSIIADG